MIRRKLPVCKISELPTGGTRSFRYGVANGLAYNDRGTIKAYVNRCTHMGGTVDLASEGVLRCRWHRAEFDPKTGARVAGQAPEGTALKPIPLEIEDDQIYAILELEDEW